MKEIYNEINNESNINGLTTLFENLNNNREENNGIQASLNENTECLKPKIKIENDVEKILFIKGFIFFFCNDINEVKYPIYLRTTNKNKIIIKDKNFNNLREIELNSADYCISEIKEDHNYIIICKDNRLYKLVDNKLEFFYAMRINFIIPIDSNKYVISDNNGIFKYEDSILNITRENLENKNKIISVKQYNLGVLINERTIAFSKNDELMVFDLNKMKIILEFRKGFSENCYAFLLVENITLEKNENEKKEKMILLFGCEENQEYGFLRVVIENGDKQFLKTKNFKIYCFIQIKTNIEEIIKAFSEEYNEDYNYFLVGGYDNFHENSIKLYVFNKYYNNIEREKYIWIEKNDICRDLLKIKSIIQIDDKNLIFNCNENSNEGKGEGALLIGIKNLETLETNVYENGSLQYNLEKISGNYKFDLKIIDMPILINISIEYIYLLKDYYFIIVQQDKFSVANLKDSSFFYSFDIRDSITCICQIKENQVMISQNDGLYKLIFSDNDFKNDKVRLNKINDMKYKLILNIANKDNKYDSNEFIVSLAQKGTFLISRDISSIDENDLKNKIFDITYNIGEKIEINNNIFVLLITNIENKGILEIFEKNNLQNNYKPNESNYLYVLSKNCITLFKTNEDSNNHICLCAAKKENKIGILAINIRLPLNKSFEHFKEKAYLEISCISLFKNEKIGKGKSFTYFCIGGTNFNNKVEISLNTIMFYDDQGKNCLSFDFTKKIIFGEEIIDSINSIYQPIKDKGLIIASNHSMYKIDISNEEEEKEGVQ